jgi:hypothetical protein
MKAFELIKTLLDGWLNLEQGGVFTMHPETDEQFVSKYFGLGKVIAGCLTVGDYVYFYEPECHKLDAEFPADVAMVDENDQLILLWRVE